MNPRITKYRFLVGMTWLDVSDPLGKGEQILDEFRVTNDKAIVSKFLTGDLTRSLGGLECQALLNANSIIYLEATTDLEMDPSTANGILTGFLHWTSMFTTALWLVKDNAVNFELGFLEVWTPSGEHRTHSNFLAMTVQMADGAKPKVTFNRDELRQARNMFRNMIFPLSKWKAEEVETPIKMPAGQESVIAFRPDVPRLRRAFYFLEAARSFRDMGMKIAMYCSLFETLFSTDASEITHKIAHRIAVFLEQDPEGRCALYNRIKKAYGIRSKVVHGDEIKMAAKMVQAISVEVDEISRRIILKLGSSEELFNQFHASKDELDKYFLKESFGGAPAPNITSK